MKPTLSLLFTFCSLLSFSQNKQICITVDDLPAVTYNNNSLELKKQITQGLINTFNEYKIPAIGFVVESQLYRNQQLDSNLVTLLEDWLDAGYELGNHTYSHPDYNKTEDSIYFKNIIEGEKITRTLCKKHQTPLTYFRHPYLHTGNTTAKINSLSKFLEQHNYIASPVTIDNDDYLFAKAYHNAYEAKDSTLQKRIGSEYIKYMEKKLLIFEEKATLVFGYTIPQTLLIHASLLNSDYLDDLAQMYVKHGYTFISQSEIVENPAYKSIDNSVSSKGLSWIYRWGISKGLDDEIMVEDITISNFVVEAAKR